jgi:hypothetical protein
VQTLDPCWIFRPDDHACIVRAYLLLLMAPSPGEERAVELDSLDVLGGQEIVQHDIDVEVFGASEIGQLVPPGIDTRRGGLAW